MYEKRVTALTLLFLAGLAAVAVQLARLQIVQRQVYAELSRKGRQWDELAAVPRGRILDCRGEVLACDMPSHGLAIVAADFPLERVRPPYVKEMRSALESADERARQREVFRRELAENEMAVRILAQLTGWNVERIARGVMSALERAVRYGNERGPEPILYDLDRETWMRLDVLLNPPAAPRASRGAGRRGRRGAPDDILVPGVRCVTRARRAYPCGPVACHVAGHVGEYDEREIESLRRWGIVVRDGRSRMEAFRKALRSPEARDLFRDAFGRDPGEIAHAAELSALLRAIDPGTRERLAAILGPAWLPLEDWLRARDLVHLTEGERVWVRTRGHLEDRRLGRMGVELSENGRLRGRHGYRVVIRNVAVDGGRAVPRLDYLHAERPAPGEDVRLELDLRLQSYVQDLLDAAGMLGAAVFMEPSTGAVKVLASSPAFDPNALVSGDHASIKAIFGNPGRPMLNRATQGTYPPGSVFKVAVAAAALEEGAITASTALECRHRYRVGARQFRCLADPGHGPTEVTRALGQSCNIFFYQAAERLGGRALAEWARAFGFGQKTGIDIPNEVAGTSPAPEEAEDISRTTLVQMGIGQHPVTVTPMQVACFFATLANGGVMLRPRLATPGAPSGGHEAVRVIRLSPETRRTLMKGMLAVSHEEGGTAYGAFNDPMGVGLRSFVGEFPTVTIAAKTGTAEHAGGEPHSWFAGFCPADDPRIAFAVIIEEGGHGGATAAPLAARVLYAYFKLYPLARDATPRGVAAREGD